MVSLGLGAVAVIAVALLMSGRHGSGLLWLGPGPKLRPQVEALIQSLGGQPRHDIDDLHDGLPNRLHPI